MTTIEYDIFGFMVVLLLAAAVLWRRELRLRKRLLDQAEKLRAAVDATKRDTFFRTEMLEVLAENVVACDPDGRIVFMNRTAAAMGSDKAMAVGIHRLSQSVRMYELDGETRIPAEEAPIISALKGITTTDRRMIIEQLDGSRHVRSTSAIPIVSDEGELLGAVGTSNDITAEVLAQERLEVAARFFDVATEMVCVVDEVGTIVHVNEGWGALGWSREDLIDTNVAEIIHDDDLAAAAAEAEAVLLGKTTSGYRQRVRTKDDEWRWVDWNIIFSESEGLVYGSARDVTDRVNLERELDEQHEKLAHAQSLARMGSFERNVETGEVVWSDQLRRMFGLMPDDDLEVGPNGIRKFTHPEDTHLILDMYDTVARENRPMTCEVRGLVQDGAGTVIHVAVSVSPVCDESGKVVKIRGVSVDITERKEMEEQLQFLAHHDSLTGLPNSRRFHSDLERHLGFARRYGVEGAVMMVDIDGLKQVNDQLGHQAGDDMIRKAADAMTARLRENDIVARLGGDEFSILLPEIDRAGAMLVGASLLEEINTNSITLTDNGVTQMTASIGTVMLADLQSADVKTALAAADTAMYDAKSSGRNRTVMFDQLRHLEFMPHSR